MDRQFRIDDGRQTLVLAVRENQLAQVVYWGGTLPADENLATVAAAHVIDVTGGMLDANPDLSLCPQAADSFPGQPGVVLRNRQGTPVLPDLRFVDAVQKRNLLCLDYTDEDNGIGLQFSFRTDPHTRIIACETVLTARDPVHLQWLCAPALPAPQSADEMIDISGRWCGEFALNHTPWGPGIRLRESRTGRTGHENFPGLIVPCRGTSNTRGEAYAFHYGWSGGHRMLAEELPDGRRQIQWGHAADSHSQPATSFATAPLYITYADNGLNGCATAFQRHLRDRIVTWAKPDTPRPVHYNCWEAVYFNHSLPALKDIATQAAALGAERFVLDDGWFGMRDDDTSSLGDWTIDPRKYPQGLDPLIAHINSLGMGFGIWFEPEMVNPDSDTCRAHPDWVLGRPDQVQGRQQSVLDMSQPAVRDYLYDRIAAVLSQNAIDYIKWDHNRVLPFPDAAQTQGTYALLHRLRRDFPQVEIETCASGGGRIDFGIMQHCQRIWLSDSNDALERLHIQHNAALFLPMAVTGSHVGPRHCHTSGRTHDIGFRAWVAAQRHMGFEMDPRELTDTEAATLTRVTTWWKSNRHWTQTADILRLDSADPAVLAEQQLAADGHRFVVFAGKAATSHQIAPRPLRLTGLDPQAAYRIDLANRDDLHHLSRGTPALKTDALTLSGRYLMQHGITLPWSFPDRIWVLEGTRL